MDKSIEVSRKLIADLLDLHRLSDMQATLLARTLLGNAGNIAAELAQVSAQLDDVRSRLVKDHMQERWAVGIKLGRKG